MLCYHQNIYIIYGYYKLMYIEVRNISTAKYKQIEHDISKEIKSGVLKPGDKLKNEQYYIEKYSVSSITVRRAMRELAENGLIERVKGSGSFVSNPDSFSSHHIAFMIPYTDTPDVSLLKILRGIQQYIAEFDYSLIIEWFDAKAKPEAQTGAEYEAYEKIIQQKVQGLLLYPMLPTADNPIFKKLKEKSIPYVCIDRYSILTCEDTVGPDNYKGGALAAKHLFDLGHRNIRYIPNNFSLGSEQERFDGFCNMSRSFGIEVNQNHILYDYNIKALSQQIINREITAFLCANDSTAMKLVEELKKSGINIPKDASVVGFDNWEVMKEAGLNLTTVKQDFEYIGRTAAKLLMEKINNPDSFPPVRILTAIELLEGSTTDTLRS